MQHRDDRQRLAALVHDLAGDDLDRELLARAGLLERDPLAAEPRGADREVGDDRRELRVVPAHALRVAAVGELRRQLEQPLRLRVHEDDLRLVVGDEDRIADVAQDQVQAVALARRFLLGEPRPLVLPLELDRRALEVGDVAQHRHERALARHRGRQRLRQHLEQQVRPFVGVHEVELARRRADAAGDHRLREEGAEQEIVDLHRAPTPLRVPLRARQQHLGAPVLHDDVVVRVGDDDGIGERVDDRAQELVLLVELLRRVTQLVERVDAGENRPGEQRHRDQRLERRELGTPFQHRDAERDAAEAAPLLCRRGGHDLASGEPRIEGPGGGLSERGRAAELRLRQRQREPLLERHAGLRAAAVERPHCFQTARRDDERVARVVHRHRQTLHRRAAHVVSLRDHELASRAVEEQQQRTRRARRVRQLLQQHRGTRRKIRRLREIAEELGQLLGLQPGSPGAQLHIDPHLTSTHAPRPSSSRRRRSSAFSRA